MASDTNRASKTAELVAATRAVHKRYDDPVLLDDPFAVHLCGPFWRTVTNVPILKWLMVDIVLRRVAPIAPLIIIRAAYGERQVAAAVERGVSQYVIIGAGYDSFAMRQKNLMQSLAVYEIDTPASQTEKRRRMQKAGIAEPGGVRYIAADLSQVTLEAALAGSDFDPGQAAFFSCFGVTYYLANDSINDILDLVAHKLAPGSAIAFDYLVERSAAAEHAKDLHDKLKRFVARRGEPWLSEMNPAQIEDELLEGGFASVHHILPDNVKDEVAGGQSSLYVPPLFGLITASSGA